MIDLEKYFQRVNYQGSTDVSFDTLRGIHKAQAFSVPFENLEIHDTASDPENLRRLDETTLYHKIVENKRGGACSETNELLALVLIQLGFNVKRLLGSVTPMKRRTHKCLLVTIGKDDYLADTAYGGTCIIEPMPLITDTPVEQFSETFKLTLEYPRSEEIQEYVLYTLVKNAWTQLYSFPLSIHLPEEFEPTNYFNSHSKNSFSVNNRLVTMPTPSGRVSLHNHELKIRCNGRQQTTAIREEDYLSLLDEYFGLNFPPNTVFKPIPTCHQMHNTT